MQRKNSTGDSSQTFLGILWSQYFLIMADFTIVQKRKSFWHRQSLVYACKSHVSSMFSWKVLENLPFPQCMWLVAGSAIRQGGWQGCHDNQLHAVSKDGDKWTSFWLVITPSWVMLPRLHRRVRFMIIWPVDLYFCCFCFWDSIHASRSDAEARLPAGYHWCESCK